MPVAGSVGDCYQVRLVQRQEGQEVQNVFHFVEETATADVELHLILVLINCLITNFKPVATSKWEFVEARWKRVTPTLGPEMITRTGDVDTGGGSEVALPSFCSAVVSEHTLLGGKSKRGRFSMAGIPEADTTDSFITDASSYWVGLVNFAACVAAAFVNIGEPLGSDQFALAIYSRKLGGSSFPYNAVGFEKVSQLVPQRLIGTIRSRKQGRGV